MLTLAQQKAIAWVPRFPACLSILGSGYITTSILKDKKKKGKKLKTYHRIMLALSGTDILASFWWSLSTVPVPVGSPFVYGARGNTATCTAQGFFIQCGFMSPIYSLSLWLYYLLVISYNWNEARIKRFELGVHAFVWILGLGTASVGLVFELYNSTTTSCWISGYPLGCEDDPGVQCERGKHATNFQLGFFLIPFSCWTILGTLAMFKMYRTVQKQEKAQKKWRRVPGAGASKMSRAVADQAFWYYAGFIITWVFPLAYTIYNINGLAPFWLLILTMLFLPCQGIFNFLVFIRPRYLCYRRKHPDFSAITLLGQFLLTLIPQRKRTADTSAPESTETAMENVADAVIPDQTDEDNISEDEEEDPSLEMLRSRRNFNPASSDGLDPCRRQSDTSVDSASRCKRTLQLRGIACHQRDEYTSGNNATDPEGAQNVGGDTTDCFGTGEGCHTSGTNFVDNLALDHKNDGEEGIDIRDLS